MRTRVLIGAAAGASGFAAAGLFGDAGVLTLARVNLLGAALGAAAVYDVRERRIPNRIVLPASASCVALTFAAGASPFALLPGLTLVGFLLVTSLRWPQALGMGDVKLALLLVLGLDGDAMRALVLGLALAAFAGLVLLAHRGGHAWRISLPLAPFLAAGALLSVLS